ncbi:hypothetical protein G7Y89_g13364 [Cudoniella acicularis]|uniref:Uncharacterized protein n=1 Tax=Cudoniella acicularis TaxID=354080 RepID=A0A8H4R9S7_9HELO|nr:hypothetical protein G7Y89_g13364 [Cudoniella acicularis]
MDTTTGQMAMDNEYGNENDDESRMGMDRSEIDCRGVLALVFRLQENHVMSILAVNFDSDWAPYRRSSPETLSTRPLCPASLDPEASNFRDHVTGHLDFSPSRLSKVRSNPHHQRLHSQRTTHNKFTPRQFGLCTHPVAHAATHAVTQSSQASGQLPRASHRIAPHHSGREYIVLFQVKASNTTAALLPSLARRPK